MLQNWDKGTLLDKWFNEIIGRHIKNTKVDKTLETEKYELGNLIENIDGKIENAKQKIDETIEKIGKLKCLHNDNLVKQCNYDRSGYCKEWDSCRIVLYKEICSPV